MKRTHWILTALLAALGLGAYYGYRVYQHAQHNLVSIRITDAPLQTVLARIASQTREPIAANPALDGPVTLDVRNAPLAAVLRQIAEQIGAVSRSIHAVGATDTALQQLGHRLKRGENPALAGWTNLLSSPNPPNTGPGPRRRIIREDGPPGQPTSIPLPPGAAPLDVDVRVTGDDPNQPGGRFPNTTVRIVTRDATGALREFDLSPEQLLLQTTLLPRVPTPPAATSAARAAAIIARQADARWTTFYTLEPSPLPPGELPPPLRDSAWTAAGPTQDGQPPAPSNLETHIKQSRFDRLNRLTPEQRARHSSPGTPTQVDVDIR